MLNCAVLGATGYTGAELTKLLLAHPHVRVALLTTRQEKPIALREILPSVSKDIKLEMMKVSWPNKDELIGSTAIVLISLAILSAFIGVCDVVLSKIVNIIMAQL